MRRRHLLLGALALPLGLAWWARPRAQGAPYSAEFARRNALLGAHGGGIPRLLLDLDAVDHNIGLVRESLARGTGDKQLRLVAKSVPSVELLTYLAEAAGTRRLMVFHQPHLNTLAQAMPDSHMLLGKPLPLAAVEAFYARHRGSFVPERQLEWLVDSPRRLAAYDDWARSQGRPLAVNIEINVGLHRGGVTAGPELAAMLERIAANPRHLRLAGLMGYDPHVVKVPALLGSADALLAKAMRAYQDVVEQIAQTHPALWREGRGINGDGLTLNTAGSPTYRLHESESLSNDIAVGSAFVHPGDFDLPSLSGHRPAAWIATPVLKAAGPLTLPGLDGASRLLHWWDPNRRASYFVYGGHWLADPVAPAGLRPEPLFGHSTNQDLVVGAPATALAEGDHVFLRPRQSERVLGQFGPLLLSRGGEHVGEWSVLDGSNAPAA